MKIILHSTQLFLLTTVPSVNEKEIIKWKKSIFRTLLETNKPYIMNVMRAPAMQTLFLYASTIETNNDFTRILFDQWLEITFENSETAQSIISSLLLLRNARDLLLQLTLQGTGEGTSYRLALEIFAF